MADHKTECDSTEAKTTDATELVTVDPDAPLYEQVDKGDTVTIEYTSKSAKTTQQRTGTVTSVTGESSMLSSSSVKIAVDGYSYDAIRARMWDYSSRWQSVGTSSDGVSGRSDIGRGITVLVHREPENATDDESDDELRADGGTELDASDVDAGDTLELPTGDSLEILEAEHRDRLYRGPQHRFEARKADGSTVELREHHVERAFDAGAELVRGDRGADEPNHAELRDGETRDDDAHAQRTAEQLRIARKTIDEHDDDDESDDELRADGGFITDAPDAEWCQQCQRMRISCAHSDGAE